MHKTFITGRFDFIEDFEGKPFMEKIKNIAEKDCFEYGLSGNHEHAEFCLEANKDPKGYEKDLLSFLEGQPDVFMSGYVEIRHFRHAWDEYRYVFNEEDKTWVNKRGSCIFFTDTEIEMLRKELGCLKKDKDFREDGLYRLEAKLERTTIDPDSY